jgi:glutathione S-transferase
MVFMKVTLNMEANLKFFFHPMCPFAQRALYSMSYKGLKIELQELDLVSLPQWYLDMNNKKGFPTLRVRSSDGEHFLHDSIKISQYLDTFPGPSMYPRQSNGVLNPTEKNLIDLNLNTLIEPLRKMIGLIYFKKSPSPDEVLLFQNAIIAVDNAVKDGKYLSYLILDRDEISFLDIMALPLIERIIAFKDQGLKFYEGLNLNNIALWYSRITQLPFTQSFRVPPHRFINLRHHMLAGSYKGLVLPVTFYDNYKL